MITNESVKLTGRNVILIPYEPKHVGTYHKWMQDPQLQELTESEPLSLEQEYDMQQSWRRDSDKCIFILLDRSLPGDHGGAMAGDVNIFLNDPEDPHMAEIEVMVAEERSRGKGVGREALLLMMQYSIRCLGVTGFVAKIITTNVPSLTLFSDNGFVKAKEVPVFNEVHYVLNEQQCPQAWSNLQESLQCLTIEDFR
eukprot:jgi/Ulvmu1/12820/UM098_0001.1